MAAHVVCNYQLQISKGLSCISEQIGLLVCTVCTYSKVRNI